MGSGSEGVERMGVADDSGRADGSDTVNATCRTSGVGTPLLAVVVPSVHAPKSESIRLHIIAPLERGSAHPDADAMIVRGVGIGVVRIVRRPASSVVVTTASLSAW